MIFDKELAIIKNSAKKFNEETAKWVAQHTDYINKVSVLKGDIEKNITEYTEKVFEKIKKEYTTVDPKAKDKKEEEGKVIIGKEFFEQIEAAKELLTRQGFYFVDYDPVFKQALFMRMPNLIDNGPAYIKSNNWALGIVDLDEMLISIKTINQNHYLNWLNTLYQDKDTKIDIANLNEGIESKFWKTIPILKSYSESYNLIRWVKDGSIGFAYFENTFTKFEKDQDLTSAYVAEIVIDIEKKAIMNMDSVKIQKSTIEKFFKLLETIFVAFNAKEYFELLAKNSDKNKEEAEHSKKEKH